MPDELSHRDLSDFFDRFCSRFSTFDGAEVAKLFKAPGVALREDGTLRCFIEPHDIATYYQSALDNYRAAGCVACRWSDLEVQILRKGSVVASVTWDLLATGSAIRRWRQAYFMALFDGEPLIYGSAFAET
ncbi:MAG: hypothetical protein AB7L90_17775 [Hyphomicrobiaceae bacterium]